MYFSATLTPVLLGLVNEWAVQILVLFSFALQVFLLLFAWIRRHNVSPVPRLLLWIAYQLADSTALFTLGHLSISSRLQEHQLVAFWAPLLLVHLGGQDTITAYSIEDNGIWLRHLQTLIVQVLGAAYVIYKYIPGSETLIIAAAILIFIVGILKYVERILALKCASMDSIWLSLDTEASTTNRGKDALFDELLTRRHYLDTEDILMAAHGLLDVCKGLFIGLRGVQRPYLDQVVQSFNMSGHLDKLMEMELSLMYDIMYTKAVVIHTRYGLCIRIIAPVTTVAALVLFQLSNKAGHSRHDVAISYVLLVGAVVLEIASLVRAIGSTWTWVWLYDKMKQASPSGSGGRKGWLHTWLHDKTKQASPSRSGGRRNGLLHHWLHDKTKQASPSGSGGRNAGWTYRWLHDELVAFRRLVRAGRNRRWSGSVGQYNLLLSCAKATSGDRPDSKLSAAARSLGLGHIRDLWGKLRRHSHSRWVKVPGSTKELVLSEVLRIAGKDHGVVAGRFPGLVTLKDFQVTGLIGWSIRDIGFEDSIIAWHIASEICMFKDRSKKDMLVDAIEVLSNYMMFLLVECPYMLPGPVRRSRHQRVHDALRRVMGTANNGLEGPEKRVEWALRTGLRSIVNKFDDPADYDNGVRLADMLYHQSRRLQVIFGVWVEMLCFVANHCSRESHARQLSSGGELVTIVWLMASHANQSYTYSSDALEDSDITTVN